MRKKSGRQVTLYLPETLVTRAKLIADSRDWSVSNVVGRALREYLEKDDAARAVTLAASVSQPSA